MLSEKYLKLLIGTHNVGKAIEISHVLEDLKLTFLTLRDIKVTQPVPESGRTYEENAILKAEGYARQSGLLTLADDSGLEVDALNGAPGVFSARYSGPAASDRDRIDLLLAQLERNPRSKRTARFVSVVALASPDAGESRLNTELAKGPSSTHREGPTASDTIRSLCRRDSM